MFSPILNWQAIQKICQIPPTNSLVPYGSIATISDLEMHQMDVQIIASPNWGIRKEDFHGTTNLECTKSL
jgi:hypothetical protein